MSNIIFGEYNPPAPPADLVEVTYGLFFDGTKNNKDNTDARSNTGQKNQAIKAKNAYKDYGGKPTENTSYNNDWSNVARMWSMYEKDSAIYIEGIGTVKYGDDEMNGYAYGSKETGIKEKVKKGCEELAKKIKSKTATGKKVNLTLDVFGFSRGSAAARNFVHEISKTQKNNVFGIFGIELNNLGVELSKIKITVRFLGIYDTVSSYSEDVWTSSPDFTNDITELNLNDIRKAKNIIHFTANDEHRENFDLTDVRGYDNKKKMNVYYGTEKIFPGVHSDIGGGYVNGFENVDEIINGGIDVQEERKKQLIALGWFLDKQLTTNRLQRKLSSRRYVFKSYSYIPLQFMVQYCDNKNLPISLDKVSGTYSIEGDDLLIRVKKRLEAYIMGNGIPYSFKWFTDIKNKYKNIERLDKKYTEYLIEIEEQKDLRKLRNFYLHWSADYDWVGMDPRKNGKRVVH